jgi:hypothetical protein
LRRPDRYRNALFVRFGSDSGCLTEGGGKPADALRARPAPRETGGPRAAPLSLASCARIDEGAHGRLLAVGGSRSPPDGGMTAFGPRLSLAPGLIRGRPLALRAAASSRVSAARPRLSITGSDRQLDRDRAAASFRGETACLSRLGSRAKLSPGIAPTLPDCFSASDRGAGNGPRKALARSKGLSPGFKRSAPLSQKRGLLPYRERIFGTSFNTVQGDSRAHVMRS